MKTKYEISIWEDVLTGNNTFEEQKLIIIGSDTMTSESRAREPKLVTNINGTNKFSFNMYYSYIDTRTGEEVENPYIKYLVNERKIKVLWKDKWYDFIVKQIKEDQVGHLFTYTCEDAFITELSRNGFNLTFSTELENNIGTAQELVEKVIEDTDWQFDEEGSDIIYQKIEEPVYAVSTTNKFNAFKNPGNTSVSIAKGKPILLYYSCAPDINNLKNNIQFYYSGTNEWQQDENDMLVINGDCYSVEVTWTINGNQATAKKGSTKIFTLNFANGLSTDYRAERYVQTQKTVYNSIVDRYVNVYNNGELLGYSSTEFNDALAVVNLVTNPSNFSNTSGWIGDSLQFKLSPSFNSDTVVATYTAKSYLRMKTGTYFNTGIQNNRPYIPNGFIQGEKYIFRIKMKTDGEEPANISYIRSPNVIIPSIQSRNSDHNPTGTNYFSTTSSSYDSENHWLEYHMTCIKSCPYDMILSSSFPFGIFIQVQGNYWLEEAQFFKEVYGNTGSGDELVRINPGEMSKQSVAQVYWKYFDADQPAGTTKDNLNYAYLSLNEWDEAIPVYTNFERYGTIEESNSNRFNILQSIAEAFECWVFLEVKHNNKGYILRNNNGTLQKYIRLKRETGQETGIGFIYGIDLKGVVRDIKSDKISTKTIVSQNENEFGKNGFCSIARSEQNYPRENVIYNFDYYIQQGLLSKNVLYNDLYNTAGMAYYAHLHALNTEYARNLDNLLNKRSELIKQNATATIYNQYILSSKEELQAVEEDIMKMAGVDDIDAGLEYAKTHLRDTKTQTLVDNRSNIKTTLRIYQDLNASLQISLANLNSYINSLETRQEEIIEEIETRNKQFYVKYARFIQEGTWTSEDYWDDDLYYLDALQVAYTSSRPQISYEINVLRLSDLEEYSSKVFRLGDISFVQDTKYFGYLEDRITPYKEKVILTEITSYFDTPDKDTIKVQNYKTQFDDLFQRITATVQNLEFNEGKYAKAANIVTSDGTIKSSVIQSTFNDNKDLVYGAQNESAVIDNTGITVTDNTNAAKQVKVTSGGVFVTNDGGETWRNAIRGDGISTDLLTAGRINTEQITVYNGEHPSFRWDPSGLNAYGFDENEVVDTTKFVRFDQYGIYGIKNAPAVYIPTSEQQIYNDASFGLTWNKFFMKSTNGNKSIEISTDRDIVVSAGGIDRVVIGRVDGADQNNYGIRIKRYNEDEQQEEVIFECSDNGSYLSGWTLKEEYLESSALTVGSPTIRIYADGNIGCYGHEETTYPEKAYRVSLTNTIDNAINLKTGKTATINMNTNIYVFSNQVSRSVSYLREQTDTEDKGWDENYQPNILNDIQIAVKNSNKYNYYQLNGITWDKTISSYEQKKIREYKRVKENNGTQANATSVETETVYVYRYTYTFSLTAKIGSGTDNTKFDIDDDPSFNINFYVPAAETKWSIDKDGQAIFHDIYADYGKIAGWFIDTEKIYQTIDGKPDGVIKQQLSTTGSSTDPEAYSFITDAIKAAVAQIGGVSFSNGLVDGFSLVAIYNLAAQANSMAQMAYARADAAYDHLVGHRHAAGDLYVLFNGQTQDVKGVTGISGN